MVESQAESAEAGLPMSGEGKFHKVGTPQRIKHVVAKNEKGRETGWGRGCSSSFCFEDPRPLNYLH